jgi:hypothetical protein
MTPSNGIYLTRYAMPDRTAQASTFNYAIQAPLVLAGTWFQSTPPARRNGVTRQVIIHVIPGWHFI